MLSGFEVDGSVFGEVGFVVVVVGFEVDGSVFGAVVDSVVDSVVLCVGSSPVLTYTAIFVPGATC